MKNRRILDYFAGFFVGIGAPIFSISIALENYPMLVDIGYIDNPTWRFVVMRAITFGVIINAVLFFTAINFEKDRVARGILLSCLPSVAAVVLFQFILS